MIKNVIAEISKKFIDEAKSSPQMLEDLAAMEKYMAESYDGRTFVELLQNADDAGANRIRVAIIGGTLLVANDGRAFDKNDILAICRSGSSNKERGKSIGYRGVGFKSSTTISTEIIIYSSGAFFTFSKALCARVLGVKEECVPTVRIPFLIDENKIEKEIKDVVEEMEADGFKAFFLFLHPELSRFKEELTGFNSGWLLFLRNITNVEICLDSGKQKCRVVRSSEHENMYVKVMATNTRWVISEKNGVSVAFRIDENNQIVPCNSEDAVFHCFLPTIDKTGFPFKVNADFSTDPSRKHVIIDEISKELIEKAADLYVGFIISATNKEDQKQIMALNLLNDHLSLSDLSSRFEQRIEYGLKMKPWVLKNNRIMSAPEDVKYFPNWLEKDEKESLIRAEGQLERDVYNTLIYRDIDKFEKMLSKYGAQEVDRETMGDLLTSPEGVKQIGGVISGKIFVYAFRDLYTDSEIMGNVLLPTDSGCVKLSSANDDGMIDSSFVKTITGLLNQKEKKDLSERYILFKRIFSKEAKPSSTKGKSIQKPSSQKALAVNKWKTPIQNCIAVETLEGRSAKDVSRKCDEYCIESIDGLGNHNYITVKQVKNLGDSFSLSEDEFFAAQRLGESYGVFVVSQDGENVEYLYIANPANTITMEKTVKEWEFTCRAYEVPKRVSSETDESLLDERFLKNLSAEYFNKDQKAFLNDFLHPGEMEYHPELEVMIEKINAIIDFYTGEMFFEIEADKIIADSSKKNSLKKIMGVV